MVTSEAPGQPASPWNGLLALGRTETLSFARQPRRQPGGAPQRKEGLCGAAGGCARGAGEGGDCTCWTATGPLMWREGCAGLASDLREGRVKSRVGHFSTPNGHLESKKGDLGSGKTPDVTSDVTSDMTSDIRPTYIRHASDIRPRQVSRVAVHHFPSTTSTEHVEVSRFSSTTSTERVEVSRFSSTASTECVEASNLSLASHSAIR